MLRTEEQEVRGEVLIEGGPESTGFGTDLEQQLLRCGTRQAPQRTDELVWVAWSSGLCVLMNGTGTSTVGSQSLTCEML